MKSDLQPLIRWNARFNTGHAQIDDQHRDLVELLNRFAADVESDGGAQATLFARFKDTLREHFVFEENVLRDLGVSAALLEGHARHHDESMQLLDGLSRRMDSNPRDHSSAALAEIAHCLLVDLLDEDRYYFVNAATRTDAGTTPPIAPALHAFGRVFDLLNGHHERIAQARDYYLTLLDDFPTPICRADAEGRFDWFNRTWLSLTGRQASDTAADGWLDAMHPDDRNPFLATWRHNFASRIPFAIEYRLRDATGAWCWMHHIGHPFFDGENRFLGYIGTLFDITERRRAEASLRVSAVVFEHATEAIMITDAAGCIEAVNPAFSRVTGYTVDEAVGASANLLRSGFHDEGFYKGMWQAIQTRGSWQGEIINRRKNGEIFPVWLSISSIRNGSGKIARMVGVLSDVASVRGSQERLMHLAHHDALTGLPNRLLFSARTQHSIERCLREDSRLAVLFLDLDNFKPVNDLLGHKVGDRILCDVAARLRAVLRSEDTVARFGGDEFVVLVERADNADSANLVAQKLLAAFPVQVAVDGREIPVSASIGVSLYPDDGRSVDELVDAADKAMYRIKHDKRQGQAAAESSATK